MQSHCDSYDVHHCKLHQSACYNKIQNMLHGHQAITLLLVSASEYHITHEFVKDVASKCPSTLTMGHHIVHRQSSFPWVTMFVTVINKQLLKYDC